MMAQPHRSQTEALDGSFAALRLDVFADPKGVVEHVEHAADDIFDQRLRAEPSAPQIHRHLR
jgi:hypothetical protein